MIINIRDVNDLPPAFLDQSYETTVFEETVHDQTHILKVGYQIWQDFLGFPRRQKRLLIGFKTIFTKMERYLIQNHISFVLGKDCQDETGESDAVNGWEENCPWNN